MLTDDSIMKFGKYKGRKLIELPTGYLVGIYDRGIAKGELKKYIEETVPYMNPKYNKPKTETKL
ncbi:MAG: DUF3820 family protein [Ferruginibacter sp.]|nr:DUF3820 family protein [Ferruginibacter sp.]